MLKTAPRFLALPATLLLSLLAAPAPVRAAQVLQVDLGQRIEPIKRIIDFYCTEVVGDVKDGILDLKPRFVSHCGGTHMHVDNEKKIQSQGVTPIVNLRDIKTYDRARTFVKTAKAEGMKYYYHWTEPNRTWGPRLGNQDPWLKTSTWKGYLDTVEQVYRGVKEEDSSALIAAPGITGDDRPNMDPQWFTRLFEFVQYMAAKKRAVDYLSFNPPFDPRQVVQVSSLAKGMAAQYPALQLKGIGLLEYPYFIDKTSTHVRFFTTFEESWNMHFAAKSHFRKSWSNSGLVLENGTKLPVYWTFYKYARMKGMRLKAQHSEDFKMAGLASFEAADKTLYGLFANDSDADSTVEVAIAHAAGKGTASIYAFESAGAKLLRELPVETGAGGTMTVPLGKVPKGEAYYVEVKFADAQPVRILGATPGRKAQAAARSAIDFNASAPVFNFAPFSGPQERRTLDGRVFRLPSP